MLDKGSAPLFEKDQTVTQAHAEVDIGVLNSITSSPEKESASETKNKEVGLSEGKRGEFC